MKLFSPMALPVGSTEPPRRFFTPFHTNALTGCLLLPLRAAGCLYTGIQNLCIQVAYSVSGFGSTQCAGHRVSIVSALLASNPAAVKRSEPLLCQLVTPHFGNNGEIPGSFFTPFFTPLLTHLEQPSRRWSLAGV